MIKSYELRFDKENTRDSLDELVKLRIQSHSLTSRTSMLSSVLFKYRDVESLVANVDNLLNDLVLEMRNRSKC